MAMEGSTGTEVKSVLTSYDVITTLVPALPFDAFHKLLSIFDMLRGLVNLRSDDVSLFLDHVIGDGTPVRNNGPEKAVSFVGGAHRTWKKLH